MTGSKDLLDEIDRTPIPKKPSDLAGISRFVEALKKAAMDDQAFSVPIAYLSTMKNIRGKVKRDEEYLALLENIRQVGQLQPVIVQLINDKPTLVGGYRRYTALLELGMTHIRIMTKGPQHNAELLQIYENIMRADLPSVRYCESVAIIRAAHPNDTMQQLAGLLGLKDRGVVAFYLKISEWSDEAKNLADALGLSRRALIQIARQKDSNDPETLLAMLRGEKKEPAEKAGATNAKNLSSRIDSILNDIPEKNGRKRDLRKIAEIFGEMQPESRTALLNVLHAYNTELAGSVVHEQQVEHKYHPF